MPQLANVPIVANLPAEVTHLMEEITAKEQTLQEHLAAVHARDTSLQKFVKSNGSHMPHPREAAYNEAVINNLDRCQALQDEKIVLADKSSVLLDRQIKRLDVKIRDLQKEGLLPDDPPIPSLLNPDSARKTFREPSRIPHPAHDGAGNTTLGRNAASAVYTPSPNNAQYALASRFNSAARTASLPGNLGGQDRVPSPMNAASAMQFQRNHHQSPSDAGVATAGVAAGMPDAKRRRLHSFSGASTKSHPSLSATPSQPPTASTAVAPSGGFGPDTPSASTTARSASTSSGTRNTLLIKKTVGKKVAPHQQNRRGKTANAKRSKKRPVNGSAGRAGEKRNSGSPYYVDEEDDSGLSSPAPSVIDHYLAPENSEGEDDEDDRDDEEGNDDMKVYCTCQTVSHGDMVACDNDDCPHEWFHWKCVGLTREPLGAWYCDECRQKLNK